MNEFELIEHFFKGRGGQRKDVLLGVGDDAACLSLPADRVLLVSTDTLVSGVHFLPEWNPADIASKAVRVNVSDMAAMAADPCWATLALTLPESKQDWLEAFSKGLNASLKQFNVALVGGDTTRGPLSLTLTILGSAPAGQVVKRSGAKTGDFIMVSGYLGAAALAVDNLKEKNLPKTLESKVMKYLLCPEPRIDLIPFLRDYASAAIDISDGLAADLNHICLASDVGACLWQEAIPVHPLLTHSQQALDLALRGGDDYELCFTVSAQKRDLLLEALKKADLDCFTIGVIEKEKGLRISIGAQEPSPLRPQGYSHF